MAGAAVAAAPPDFGRVGGASPQRADRGSGVGWNGNTAANGLVVNGNNVTMTAASR